VFSFPFAAGPRRILAEPQQFGAPLFAVTIQLTWGARPPRAQRAAPSRPTVCTKSVHCLVRPCTPVFGARARRTAAEAAALPINSNCIVALLGGPGEDARWLRNFEHLTA